MDRLALHGGRKVRTTPWVSEFQGVEALGDEEKARVLAVLEKKRIFRYLADGYEDSEARQLENEYRELTGCSYALAVNAGTSALISALIGIGVGPGDEVIIPAFAWVATAAAVLEGNAVPVLCEIDDSLTLDPADLEAKITPHTKAVIAVHMRGMSCDIDPIMAVADRHGLLVVEDVAQSNGGTYKGRPLGSIGRAGCFSLQQYKIITSGEGGVVVTDSEPVWQRAAMYHDCGQNPFKYSERKIETFSGQNYRITELQAALCLGQIDRMRSIIQSMREQKRAIVAGLQEIPGVFLSSAFGTDRDLGVSAVLYISEADRVSSFAEALSAEGIPCEVIYRPERQNLHIYPFWDFLMQKRDPWGGGYPWNADAYKGQVSYAVDMCPKTLDLLGRAVQIRLNQYVTADDSEDLVQAVRKTALSILK